ncbi:MAG: aldose epimerase family protein [Promethearchaeota archaeon]
MLEYSRTSWGGIHGQEICLYTISDKSTGFSVSLTNIGASIVRVRMPDRNGNISDIHYGHETPEDYFPNDLAYLGSTVGRVCSVLAFAEFELNGKTHKLSKNMAKTHCMHGGFEGISHTIWDCLHVVEDTDNQTVIIEFVYYSLDGEEGFPGNVNIKARYYISPMKLGIEFKVTTDQPTIVNLTNHAYWNLDGLFQTIDNLELQANASSYLHVSPWKVIGQTLLHHLPFVKKKKKFPWELRKTQGTPMDLHKTTSFKKIFQEYGDVDNNFLLDGFQGEPNGFSMHFAAMLRSPKTGRKFELHTTEPSMMIYTGNNMKGVQSFKQKCKKHDAICFEPSRPPDAIHQPSYRDWVILKPEAIYYSKMEYRFFIED